VVGGIQTLLNSPFGECVAVGISSVVRDLGVRNCPKKEPLMHLKVRRRCGGGRGQR